MGIRIGTVFTGTVDQVGDESIQTRFFMIGVPLIPMESYFVLRDNGNGVEGFSIPLNAKSVMLAYLRWGAFIAAVAFGVMLGVSRSYERSTIDWILGIGAPLAWVVLTFFVGKPSRDMVARRSIFKAATGVSATPDLLPSHVAKDIYATLKNSPMPENVAWKFVSYSYQAHLESSDAARTAAEDAWSRLAQS